MTIKQFLLKGGKLHSLKLFCLLSLSILATSSCIKDEYFDFDKMKDVTWNPDIAIPIVHATIRVDDVLDRFNDDDLIVVDSVTGMLALKYYSTVFSIEADQLISLPDDNQSAGYTLTAGDVAAIAGAGSVTAPVPPITFAYTTANGEALDSIIFDGGNLQFTVDNNTPYPGNATVNIPGLKNAAGASFSQNITFTGLSFGQVFANSLAGYHLDMTVNGTTSNAFSISGSITFNNGGIPGAPGQTFNITCSLLGMDFDRAYGDIGQQLVQTGLDSVRLRIFDNAYNGIIHYYDPKLTAHFFNSYGCPVQIQVNQFTAHSDFNPPLAFVGLGPIVNIIAPTMAEQGQYKETTIVLDTTTSNLRNVIDISPDYLAYDVDGTTNLPSPSYNFVLDTSKIRMDVDVELPLDGTAEDFATKDTVDFVLNDSTNADSSTIIDNISDVEYLILRIAIDNGFPCEGKAQAYFTDSNYVKIDSIFAGGVPYFFKSGIIDANGFVVERGRQVTDIKINKARYDHLKAVGVKYLIFDGQLLETTDLGTRRVKILQSYSTEIFLGVRAKFKYNVDM